MEEDPPTKCDKFEEAVGDFAEKYCCPCMVCAMGCESFFKDLACVVGKGLGFVVRPIQTGWNALRNRW